ncbi:MAG: B12-binding domain-containing protein [Candidatus Moduliflexus flocculans]|nr:B12-binding domain-containing protein [Candidatus Moduliflexus flocculans]
MAIQAGHSPQKILTEALVPAMQIVGDKFRCNEVYVPEVLVAARAMKKSLAMLKPLLTQTGAKPVGTAVIGTVKGDLHDIGKNLVGMMLEGAGFEVVDLGVRCGAREVRPSGEGHRGADRRRLHACSRPPCWG